MTLNLIRVRILFFTLKRIRIQLPKNDTEPDLQHCLRSLVPWLICVGFEVIFSFLSGLEGREEPAAARSDAKCFRREVGIGPVLTLVVITSYQNKFNWRFWKPVINSNTTLFLKVSRSRGHHGEVQKLQHHLHPEVPEEGALLLLVLRAPLLITCLSFT
jgi:hypothetical protein